jgi:hypothetical protein
MGELPSGGWRQAEAVNDGTCENSLCPYCGRESKTVSGGVCADCWGVKDPDRALVLRDDKPRTWPLFDFDLAPDGVGSYVLWVLAALLVAAITKILVGSIL